MKKTGLATDVMQPIARLDDAQVLIIHWIGGLQAAERDKDHWQILPILHESKPSACGYYSRAAMQDFMSVRNVKFVAFQHMSWTDGKYSSHWAPLIPGQTNFQHSAADLWGRAAANLGRSRTQHQLRETSDLTEAQFETIYDAQGETERLARSISLSLRNLNTTVEQISSFYNQELTNLLAEGSLDGSRWASTRDQSLYALVHSFFLHLGAARDYLAAFIVAQMGMDPVKTDSMARLVGTLRGPQVAEFPILKILVVRGYIEPIDASSTKWRSAGWLKAASDMRNEFTHRRTYGHTLREKTGHLRAIDADVGLYRYYRPISLTGEDRDVFDVILSHYEKLNELFLASAKASGLDISMLHITEKDIISVKRNV